MVTINTDTDAQTDDTAAAQGAAPAYRYAAFMSYSHRDRRAAERLHSFLESYRIPRDLVGRITPRGVVPERLRPIFRDREDLAAAHDLSIEIDTALMESHSLIVLCSPHAAVSRWANIEVERFKALRGDSRVFAAILSGEPFASDHPARIADECFPPALRSRQTADGPVRIEPVGADLRREGDGLHAGRLKLIAGIIGVPLDQLLHRDARRRHRRTLALVIALLLGLALTSGLALFALRARDEAVRQRAEAEGLIEFMLGDLRKKLEPSGKLGALDTLGEHALAFYQRQDAGALDPDSLGRRARVVQLIGEIQDQRGNLDSALANFETAAASTAELLARDPNNARRIFDHAQSVYWVGYIAYRRGNFAKAEPAFEKYRQLAEQLVRLDPANPQWRAEIDYAYSNLGTLRFAQGRNADAAAAFARSLEVAEAVAASAPADAAAQLALATSLAWVADAHERLGELTQAQAERNTEIAVIRRVLARDPENSPAQLILLVAERATARIALTRGEIAAAWAAAARSVASADRLLKLDPANTEWSAAAATTHLLLGQIALAAGDVAGAQRSLATAYTLTRALRERDTGVTKWRMLAVRARLLRAAIFAEQANHAGALAVARAAEAGIGTLGAAGRDDSDARWLLGNARWQAAEALRALDRSAEARAEYKRIIAETAPPGIPEEPRMTALRDRTQAQLKALPATAA